MKRKKYKPQAIVIILAATLLIGIAFGIIMSSLNKNFEQQNAALLCSGIFLIVAIIALIATVYFLRKNSRDRDLVNQHYELVQFILTELGSAVFSYDMSTQKIIVSENFSKIFGQTISEDWKWDHDNKVALYSEADYEAFVRTKREVEKTGKSKHVVVQAYNKDGELRWFRVIMAPLYHQNKQIDRVGGMVVDVTERREEHQSIMMEQDILTLAVKNLATLVLSCNLTQNKYWVVNFDDDLKELNLNMSTYDEMVDYGSSLMYGESREKFKDVFSRENLLDSYKRGEKSVELECKMLDTTGERWISVRVLFVNNSLDDNIYAVALSSDITVSKQYEMLLQKTFDSTIENMQGFVGKWLFKDGDILLMYANKKYLEFIGATEEEAFGKSVFLRAFSDEINTNIDEKNDILKRLYDCEKQKKPINSILRGWKMNGEPYWLKVQASYFEEEDGCSVYYGTVTNVTEQINTQHKLSQTVEELKKAYVQVTANNVYRSLIDSSQSGGIIVRTLQNSREKKILYVSQGMLDTCGYTEEEFMTSIIDGHCKFHHPDDLQHVNEADQKLKNQGDEFSIEYRLQHKDGHYFWVIEHAVVATMPNGEKVVTCRIVDISVQKSMEEKLRIKEEEYKIAASLSNYAILSYDVASHSYEVIANKEKEHDFERAKKDVPEYAISIGAIAPESIEEIRGIFDDIERGEQRDKSVVAFCSSKGKKYWLELSYTIIFDDSNKPKTAIIVFNDVSEKMQAEALFNISNTFLDYSKNATKLIVVNLTKRTIRYETEGAHGLIAEEAETTNSTGVLTYYTSNMVVPEDEEACNAFFSAEHFMDSYQKGIMEESLEYRGYTADNEPHWYNAQTRLLENSYTHDIILYIVLSDINEQKLAELELMRRAETDSLTSLLNRESFESEIQIRCFDTMDQDCEQLNALVIIDIDRFKTINDTYGHHVGDETLCQIANRLKDNLRGDDVVARFGGDEFILLLPNMPSTEMIEQRCEKLCAAINFNLSNGFAVTGSVGIAICPEDGKDYTTLLKNADAAMYQAKNAGGNRWSRHGGNGAHQIAAADNILATNSPPKKVFARTFGYFDIFVDESPLFFTSAKEKELLAILIDRNGGTLTAGEAISILWENEPAGEKQNARYRKLAMGLKNTLEEAGIGDIMVSIRGVRSIDKTKLVCDYYQFLKGDSEFRRLYHNAYMTNYSWSEETLSILDDML